MTFVTTSSFLFLSIVTARCNSELLSPKKGLAQGYSDEYYNSKTYEDNSYYDNPSEEDTDEWYMDAQEQVITRYKRQYVDQLNIKRKNFWNQKCYQNTEFWKPDSPIYLYIGGNNELLQDVLEEGLIFYLANKTNGVMFAAQHRYYGERQLTRDLEFLHSNQALYDLFRLIESIKIEPQYKNSKVVVIGGGYAGNLAVWMKAWWPDLIDVAIASGAPLLAKPEIREYSQEVLDQYAMYAPRNCSKNIEIVLLSLLLCKEPELVSRECLHFHSPFCETMDMRKEENILLYFISVFSIFSDGVERGLREMHRVCKRIRDTNYDYAKPPIFEDYEMHCNNFDVENFIKRMNDEDNFDRKLWFYQCCNEFGFFITISNWHGLNGTTFNISNVLPLKIYLKLCAALFGDNFLQEESLQSKINDTNLTYGGKKPSVKNVIFTFGSLDPWMTLGATESYSEHNVHIVTKGAGHCRDLRPVVPSDPAPYREARKKITTQLIKMLNIKK